MQTQSLKSHCHSPGPRGHRERKRQVSCRRQMNPGTRDDRQGRCVAVGGCGCETRRPAESTMSVESKDIILLIVDYN